MIFFLIKITVRGFQFSKCSRKLLFSMHSLCIHHTQHSDFQLNFFSRNFLIFTTENCVSVEYSSFYHELLSLELFFLLYVCQDDVYKTCNDTLLLTERVKKKPLESL